DYYCAMWHASASKLF
nr:immunoglobulin light chain junction region [Macaca mulatta]MOX28304.1 immunoglobulin light chain junction region [Macaca mulatta]MOX28319.1 immunoglobulin light chain junction region [Macaca mulatta]MOX28491.1 immunoglobulin light chain junction region [Macaca mulatta]MOX28539.1 immunoglobulin light chain junction region [Macaca mulatta]